MKIEIEISNGKLFYRHFSSENDHGVWERPFNVSDLSVCGKIVDLCEELFKHQINNTQVESITYKIRGEK